MSDETHEPKAPAFTPVYHPTFPGVSNDVPTKDVKKWTDAGWRKTPLADEK